MINFKAATRSLLHVGQGEAKGQGFVIGIGGKFGEDGEERVIVTAAHCLPFVPPANRASFSEERRYENLLAPLGKRPTVWADCLFVDPVADLAVLGSPHSSPSQGEAFDTLVKKALPLRLSTAIFKRSRDTFQAWHSEERQRQLDLQKSSKGQFAKPSSPPKTEMDTYVRPLNGQWRSIRAVIAMTGITFVEKEDITEPGMSGSPILDETGGVIGVVGISGTWPQATVFCLPGWMLWGQL
jgi:hypothetical protein